MTEAELRIALEDFRFWLADEIGMGIVDDPPTTCLWLARARIDKLKEHLANARSLITEHQKTNAAITEFLDKQIWQFLTLDEWLAKHK